MPGIKKTILLLAAAAGTAAVTARYFTSRRVKSSELLADILLQTDRLLAAKENAENEPEAALAACALYVISMTSHSAEGLGMPGTPDAVFCETVTRTHPYTGVVATVIPESSEEGRKFSYAVNIPDTGDVRGARVIQGFKMNGRPVTDMLQITLGLDYTAQVEAEMLLTESLSAWQTRTQGNLTFRDNKGCVGRIYVGAGGGITGTVTRDAHVVGRFEGKLPGELRFRRHTLPAARSEETVEEGPASE